MTDYLHALPSGYRIEEYELVRVLGSGGFGITYLGYDHHLDKAVAIKEYLPNDLAIRTDNNSVLPKSTQDQADYEWGLARFLTEAQTLARFDHRHIIKIHRFFRAHGTGYSVMEYAEGETLTEVLQRKGTLTESELKAILFPILDGLEAVHVADFLHRDIKPSNIVIRDDGSPVLIDFGSARQAVAGKSHSVTAIVTPGYAPIEQYSAKGHQGPWTDIYALGAVCYRCLAGEPPDDATERLREDPLVHAAKRCEGKVSATLLDAIDQALRVDEVERPQSVAEWRHLLVEEGDSFYPYPHLKKQTAQPATQIAGQLYRRSAEQASASSGDELKAIVEKNFWVEAAEPVRALVGEMVSIPDGTFRMGDLSGEGSHFEIPVHSVTVPAFQLGKYQVTLAQWNACFADGGCNGYRPYCWDYGNNLPVRYVSWDDVQSFIGWLNNKTGGTYRLPTEAEWEYAARAGTTTEYSWGDEIGRNQANYDSFSFGESPYERTAPVGSFPSNPWGLHDMHGNVREWVQDCWNYSYEGAPTDGSAWTSGDCRFRVLRGGSYMDAGYGLRSARRNPGFPSYRGFDYGFRLAQDE